MQVGWATRPKPGEHECGDRVLMLEKDGHLLLSVVDGLGHGPQAALAALAATDFVTENAGLPLSDLFRRCDRIIAGTRGVAMTIVRICTSDLTMQHAGIGNVQCEGITQERVKPIPQPGVVGGRFRRIKPMCFQLYSEDRLVLYSDGISSRLQLDAYKQLGAQETADAILRDWGKDHDDATCAVLVC